MRLIVFRVFASVALAVAVILTGIAPATPAYAAAGHIRGKVRDSVTLKPLAGVCVYLGIPGSLCLFKTAVDGSFDIDLDALAARDGGLWEIYFKNPGYHTDKTNKFTSNGGYTFGQDPTNVPEWFPLKRVPRANCTDFDTILANPPAWTTTVYFPNITRRLGGAEGWYTPFIVQNTGTAPTTLEVSFYRFSDGTCVSRFLVQNLQPGTSYSNDPNDNVKNPTLPDDTQFSVVVASFGSPIVGVVNEHTANAKPEALSYNGFTSGAKTVYLPNITRRFFGLFVTPFIIQNLGDQISTVTSTFRSFDGTITRTVVRTIEPGRSKAIDPNSDDSQLGAPGLVDNKQYSVTVSSPTQDVAVVVNTHGDAAGVENPLAYATDGVTTGAATIYGAYAAKNAQGVGRYSTIVVQNLGAAAVTPKITFTKLVGGTGTDNTYTFPAIQPGASKPFDPRFSFSTQGTTNTPCTTGGPDCLADGEYSFKIEGGAGTSVAAQVNVFTTTTAMGYATTATPAAKYFLPNITKGFCFCPNTSPTVGWTTPILLQSVTATSVTLRWYNFLGGALAFTQTVTLPAGSGTRVDPWSVTQLTPDRQYSVVVDGGTGTVNAIVTELRPDDPGDSAMIYEGFAATP